MKKYFEAVTLGAFINRDEKREDSFLLLIREMNTARIVLHFMLLAVALNFPVMLAIVRLEPFELYSRLYGANFTAMLPDELGTFLLDENGDVINRGDSDAGDTVIDEFNLLMLQNEFGKKVVLPLTGMAFVLVLVLQIGFYFFAALCLGLQRMVTTKLSFRDRMGFLIFSSTLPASLAVLFGLWMPTVHLLVFYFAVILMSFKSHMVTRQLITRKENLL
jgi:hypothetical protein